MSNQCKCRLAKLFPHRKEKCTLFGKDGLLISPDASKALYNKPAEATPVEPTENSKPGGQDPPVPEDQKPSPPNESQDGPPSAGDGQSIPPTSFTEEKKGPTNDPNVSESSESARERLEKLVADAIQGANLPPGTSINVTINVNTPEPPLPSDESAGGPSNKGETFEDEYIETGPAEAEPVEAAAAYSHDLKERNDILASVSVEPTSPLAFGYSVATPVSAVDELLEGLEYVKSEDNLDQDTHLSVSPSVSAHVPLVTLPRPVHPVYTSAAVADSSPVLALVPPSPPATTTYNSTLSHSPPSSTVPVSPAFQASIEEQPSFEDLMAGLMR